MRAVCVRRPVFLASLFLRDLRGDGVRRARPRPASARPRGVAARRWRAGGVQARRRPPREFGTARTPSTRPASYAGATRNFESWRQQDEAEEKFEGERKEAAEANAMSALESKTLDSKIEMDILDALDEIKAYNERHERVDRSLSVAPH